MTQIESQQRMQRYNQWLPHVHVDFHEQGINEPYYFPPAAEPYHEVITDWQKSFKRILEKITLLILTKKDGCIFPKKYLICFIQVMGTLIQLTADQLE